MHTDSHYYLERTNVSTCVRSFVRYSTVNFFSDTAIFVPYWYRTVLQLVFSSTMITI